MEYKKCIFSQNAILAALLYSGFISRIILTISIQKSSRYLSGADYIVYISQLIQIVFSKVLKIDFGVLILIALSKQFGKLY